MEQWVDGHEMFGRLCGDCDTKDPVDIGNFGYIMRFVMLNISLEIKRIKKICF